MDLLSDLLVTLLGLGTVGAYVWSVRSHFSSSRMPGGAWVVSAAVSISTFVLVLLTWSLRAPLLATVAGLVLQAGGALLFVAAVIATREARLHFVFDPELPGTPISSGPYGFVRHPFYVSYILFWLGWSVAAWSPLAIPIPIVFVALYWAAAAMEERTFGSSPFAAEYQAYRKRVGFMFPKMPGASGTLR